MKVVAFAGVRIPPPLVALVPGQYTVKTVGMGAVNTTAPASVGKLVASLTPDTATTSPTATP